MSEELIPYEEDQFEKMLKGLDPLQKRWINTAILTFNNISNTARETGISRFTYYSWLRRSPEFKAVVEGSQFEEMLLDFAESKLVKNINDGCVASTIFFLKTKGKKRGYVEKMEVAATLDLDKAPTWTKQSDLPAGYDPFLIEDAEVISVKSTIPNEKTP